MHTPRSTSTPLLRHGSPGVQRFVLYGAALALGILGLYQGQALLMPLALAALLAFVLDPVVVWLRRHAVPRGLAVGLVLTLALAAVGLAGALVAQQVSQLGQELPSHRRNIQEKLHDLRPALVPGGAMKEVARLMGMVEGEFDAAAEVIASSSGKPAPRPTRVAVEPDSKGPISMETLTALGVQLATAALVVILVAYLLLQRRELRDRLLRLMGGDPHQMADALGESAERVSRYLLAQVMVNAGYGIPMALGLWWIGVPGAFLWGALAAVLRFVPFLGPAVGALFPLVMAFAIDPGWSMVWWTLGLIAVLELVSNNIIEPLAYGSSTGVSPLAVLLSAAFWASLWGPAGLVLATPMTVCLVVVGRHLAPLRFLDILLSDTPVFDPPTRLYHRLIAGDQVEAQDLARQAVRRHSLQAFCADTALPMLALAERHHARHATPAHRLRLREGMAHLLADLRRREVAALAAPGLPPDVLCVGLRRGPDAHAADLLALLLQHQGRAAQAVPMAALLSPATADHGQWRGVRHVWMCTLQTDPLAAVQRRCRRLQQCWPGVQIDVVVLATGDTTAASASAEALRVHRGMQAVLAAYPPATPVRVVSPVLPQQRPMADIAPAQAFLN